MKKRKNLARSLESLTKNSVIPEGDSLISNHVMVFLLRNFTENGASADKKAVIEGLEELRNILKDYELENVFNFDETALFFRLLPNTTLATGPVSGSKKSKERATVGLLVNATG